MPERTLILLRHAKSDWAGDEPDDRRPLAKRGLRQAPEAGQWLAANVDRIDLAVTSPALRARATWELASAELEPLPETVVDDRVYAATSGQLLHVVRQLDDEHRTVVLVGHNPGLEDLVNRLTGEWVEMTTSAIAVVDLPGGWAGAGEEPAATLRTSGRPPS
jgi:phosphohistidine phosphatase